VEKKGEGETWRDIVEASAESDANKIFCHYSLVLHDLLIHKRGSSECIDQEDGNGTSMYIAKINKQIDFQRVIQFHPKQSDERTIATLVNMLSIFRLRQTHSLNVCYVTLQMIQ
jgi:hypothetical protein